MTEKALMTCDTTLSDDEPYSRHQVPASSDSPTLLPGPLASLVSFATATSSLGLRIGAFVGNAAISGARVGTLTSFELGRVVLEGILARAGNDVVEASLGEQGRAEAEGLLTRALSTLHYSITSTSFLLSTGFQIGSTSLSSGIAISQFFLSGLDAVLGDTETSKAVATIVVLVQREFKNPETGISGEKVGLGDLIVGATAFALLQRWGRKKTDQELAATNVTEIVWDVVVLNDGQGQNSLVQAIDNSPGAQAHETPAGYTRPRSVSFVSATGERETFEAIGDGGSFISTASSRAFSNAGGHLSHPAEEAFRRQLADHLKPGSSVRLTAESLTRDCVTVEVQGDHEAQIDPPAGFRLVAVDRQSNREDSSTFVFQRQTRKRRHGSFAVEEQSNDYNDMQLPTNGDSRLDNLEPIDHSELETTLERTLSNEHHDTVEEQPDNSVTLSGMDVERSGQTDQNLPLKRPSVPVTANQKRPRSPMISRSEQRISPLHRADYLENHLMQGLKSDNQSLKVGLEQSPLRKALSKSKSVKNLVDFWSRERQRNHGGHNGSAVSMANAGTLSSAYTGSYPVSNTIRTQPLSAAQIASGNIADGMLPITDEEPPSFLREPRPTSSMSHRRNRSSVYSTTSIASENSLVLRPLLGVDDIDDPATFLHRSGALTGQFPRNLFATNVARFARFALASYGSNFLRLTGTFSGPQLTSMDDQHLPEHHSFSTYTNLPASTVLLSSYVDPQGGFGNNGDVESGMPLVHYVSLDHACKSVVLTCRGTLGFEDILTDMTCDYTNIIWQSETYQVHKGMYSSAKRLFTLNEGRVLATIRAALEEFEDYGLVLCGHSMGGAVAAVLAIILAEKNTTSAGGASRFVTRATRLRNGDYVLPPNRPLHVYAYGPAACVSPELQYATRGLITSIVHGNDVVPFLSLGTLRDFQAVALAFKIDSHVAKAEVRQRVWESLVNSFRNKSGLGGSGFNYSQDWLGDARVEQEDHWAWSALKSLRASLLADKLVPPGEVYLIESSPVLQRHAFVSSPSAETPPASSSAKEPRLKSKAAKVREENDNRRSFKPATRVTFRHVTNVERRFGEIRFAAGMFADHFPARYLTTLENLEKAVGS